MPRVVKSRDEISSRWGYCDNHDLSSYERIDVVIGGELVVRHKGEMVCHEKVVKMPWQEVWNDYKSCKVRVGSNGNLWWEASVLLGGVQVAREDDRGVTEGREVVRKVFQQHGSRAKRKLSRCGRNQIGQVPSGKGNVDVVPWSREGGRSEARMSSNVAWAWTNEYEKRKEMVQFLDKVREPLFGEDVWFMGIRVCVGYVRLDNQSIERDRLIGIGFVLDFVEFISFTFGDKEMILVIEAVSR
ncbi:hypothetical protein Tco_0583062 [Tanacetum coccineum]